MIIPEVIEDGDLFQIPIYGSDEKCYLLWHEEETIENFLKRASKSNYSHIYDLKKVLLRDYDHTDIELGSFSIGVYEVFCHKTDRKYFLLCCGGALDDPSGIFDCLCVPRNRFNLLTVYKEFLVPFSEKKIAEHFYE